MLDYLSVALQFPEGLLLFACIIADILERFLSHLFLQRDIFLTVLQSYSVIAVNCSSVLV